MRLSKIVICLALMAALAACGESAPTSPTATHDVAGGTLATAGKKNDNGAVVHRGEIGCDLVDGTGAWFKGDWSLPCGIEVATNSKNLNATITVRASGVPNPTGRTVHWGPNNPGWAWEDLYEFELSGPPYPCTVFGTDYSYEGALYTVNWHAMVTPSGQATLVCHYQKKWEFNCEDYGTCLTGGE